MIWAELWLAWWRENKGEAVIHETLVKAFEKEGFTAKRYERPGVGGVMIAWWIVQDGVVVCRWTAQSQKQGVTPYVVNLLKEHPRHDLFDYCPGFFEVSVKTTLERFRNESQLQSLTDEPFKVWS